MSVLQPWVEELTLMQQTVLITATRGPDGIQKDHIAKILLRWYRRCILYSAFDGKIFKEFHEPGGGSFMGPSPIADMNEVIDGYLRSVDEIPHHFQLHLMHASEIIAYCHPDEWYRNWWFNFYKRVVNDAHLTIETRMQMMKRLGDNEKNWRDAEEVTAL